MYPNFDDMTSSEPLDFERLRYEIVSGTDFAMSFGRQIELQDQFDLLEKEFAGQNRLKFVHASLNVMLRRNIATRIVYGHFLALWRQHGDILIEMLDSRWLISACDTISDHSPDPAESQSAILISLFANTLKLFETERLMCDNGAADPDRIKPRTPLHDGLTAYMPRVCDMPANLLHRLSHKMQPDTLTGLIGRELITRALSSDTVFARLSNYQRVQRWTPYLHSQSSEPPKATVPRPLIAAQRTETPGYILLNDTARLGNGFHLGTAYACESLRRGLQERGLGEMGWANDQNGFDALLSSATQKPALVVLNGEGTLHHGAPRAAQLMDICGQARRRGIPVAVLNTVWEENPDDMVSALDKADLVYVRDSMSKNALPAGFAAKIVPDMSIPLFYRTARDGQFAPPVHRIGVIDSVVPAVSASLLNFSEAKQLPFYVMPGRNLGVIRADVAGRKGSVWPRLLQITDMMSAEAWLTGRFHGLIAALSAGLPVCAVRSNTAKIEGSLGDAGLSEACLLGRDWLTASDNEKHQELSHRFDMQRQPDFIAKREDYLENAMLRIEDMFDQTAYLSKRSRFKRLFFTRR